MLKHLIDIIKLIIEITSDGTITFDEIKELIIELKKIKK